jgi:hypothetical protein
LLTKPETVIAVVLRGDGPISRRKAVGWHTYTTSWQGQQIRFGLIEGD